MYGDDYEYAASRLEGTIVRLRGKPVMVHKVTRDCEAKCTFISNGRRINSKVVDLNLKPVSLGYVNYMGQASYVSRMPKRRDWRQGFRYSSIISLCGIRADAIPYTAMYTTIVNKFPDLEACLKVVAVPGMSAAFHRHWAVAHGNQLMYKGGELVGTIDDQGSPVLYTNKQYLSEYLRECIR